MDEFYPLIEHYGYLIVSFGVALGTTGIPFPSAAILLAPCAGLAGSPRPKERLWAFLLSDLERVGLYCARCRVRVCQEVVDCA
jgi:hypothetical protein